ncbi:aminotransferase class I/II-fold pyridoxal phosphate-dependent enzyme [Coriobacteriia bacterium Es71-Z0120]|uniref:aminotransferase class I/II-fold pyridoxal phosphate-dependent enzyme n=1 Tax=Parvivirga hydrogeniphila TaxID=2939460 RepID=UPI002261022F|nr:aminotransferase class I/II-fold pyridoxal phosphate-dependent enzyme [Parvivirga hydrogeniphila]MCL4079446.1 aminotransferase class I/II-fold pyridoxal phosphate-dependent enzyme [Parvivirga hydrogeniphila]
MDIFGKCFEYSEADEARASGYYPYFRVITSESDSKVRVGDRDLIMLGSNNYLGLTTHPHVRARAREALDKYGTSCTGSRLLNGNLDIHEELERRLAKFVGKEAALVFSTGFGTNIGTISAIVTRHDYAVIDKDDHASIYDGCKLSWGKAVRFEHNDPESLREALGRVDWEHGGALVVVDGVFSMEGDVAPLPEMLPIIREFGARLMVDDAHASGVLGPNGEGTAAHFGLTDEVDLIMGTFSKSFASLGGFIAGDAKVIDYIKHNSRPFIFSAAMAPPSVGACLGALDVMESEPEHRERLWRIVNRMHAEYRRLGFDTGNSTTPVIPIVLGDEMLVFEFWRRLLDAGIFVNPVRPPAVPQGRALLRTSYMATHTDEQMDYVLETFERIGRELGVIGG